VAQELKKRESKNEETVSYPGNDVYPRIDANGNEGNRTGEKRCGFYGSCTPPSSSPSAPRPRHSPTRSPFLPQSLCGSGHRDPSTELRPPRPDRRDPDRRDPGRRTPAGEIQGQASPSQDANTRREDARASTTPPRCATASSARRPSEMSYSPRSSSLTTLLAATSRAGEEGERVLCASAGGRPGVQDPGSVPVHAAPATSCSPPGGSSPRPARTHMAPRVSRRAGARRGPRTTALADAAGQ
jgi:hypothetical protein